MTRSTTTRRFLLRATTGVVGTGALLLTGASGASASPTCAGTLGIAVHGQHVVGDYVSGIGHDALGWPATGQVGVRTAAAGGAVLPGGPGPSFHGEVGVRPGASFCLEQAQSDGAKLSR